MSWYSTAGAFSAPYLEIPGAEPIQGTDPNIDSLPYEPPPCPYCGAAYVEVCQRLNHWRHYIRCSAGHVVETWSSQGGVSAFVIGARIP